jgi:lipopolysaccharide export system protein LptA
VSGTVTGALCATLAFAALGHVALAATPAQKPANATPFLPGGNSKEPISIDAQKLVYFDKEQKAIYTGDVVVIQGDTKLTCAILTIFLSKDPAPAAADPSTAKPAAAAADAPGAPAAGSSQVKHMEAQGPVTVVSKTQVATGDRATYDKGDNKVWMFGHVTLSDGSNVTKGDKLTYDLTTGQALVEVDQTGQRVHGQFIPGQADDTTPGADKAKPQSPAQKKKNAADAAPSKQ